MVEIGADGLGGCCMSVWFFSALLFVASGAVCGLLAINGWAETGFAAICSAPFKPGGCCGAIFGPATDLSIPVCNCVSGLPVTDGGAAWGLMPPVWEAGALTRILSLKESCGAALFICCHAIHPCQAAAIATTASTVNNQARRFLSCSRMTRTLALPKIVWVIFASPMSVQMHTLGCALLVIN